MNTKFSDSGPSTTGFSVAQSRSIWPLRSLMARVLIVIVLPMALLQVIAIAFFYDVHWRSVTSRLVQSVRGEMVSYIAIARHHPDALFDMQDVARRKLSTKLNFVPGARLDDEPDLSKDWFFRRPFNTYFGSIEGYKSQLFRSSANRRDYVYQVQLDEGVVEMVFTDKRIVSPTIATYFSWLLGSFVIVALLAAYFMRQQMLPILGLAKSATNYGRGQPTSPLRVRGASEVRTAIAAFNTMRAQLENFRQQQRDMLQALSHDVRSPLARMRVQTSFLTPSEERTALEEDLKIMDHMLRQFVDFSLEGRHEEFIDFDLGAVVQRISLLYEKHLSIDVVIPKGPTTFPGREQSFCRLLGNLLDNADRYARRVRLTLKSTPKNILIVVEDDGPGIPINMRRKVLRPFFRMDSARTPLIEPLTQTGLGLALCYTIVQQHHGKIVLGRSSLLGGLKVVVALPGKAG